MKIDSTGPIRSAPVKKGGAAQKTSRPGQFAKHMDDSVDGVSTVAPSAPAHSVDGVLAIQDVGDATEDGPRARARKWGFDTLDQLELIKLDLLAGAMPKGRLMNLARIVAERRERTEDPTLDALLDHIELRVRVEIAKYEPSS
ncbi:MAG: flagellar assembly protein FliX [Alphaproteobacteria bacterium]|nr:flagellar assembly protein FliX [Alphaproteobacteria bacterium]